MKARPLLHRSGITRAVRELELAVCAQGGRLVRRRKEPRSDESARLNLLAVTPTYVPEHRRGAEVTLHATLAELVRRGHHARVVIEQGKPMTLDGVDIVKGPRRAELASFVKWSDIVFGQLTARQKTLRLAARHRRPAVYFVHVGNVDRRALAGHPSLTVFSSETVRDRCRWMSPAIVLHPPIDRAEYATTPGSAITLVNLTEPKGASLFFELARRMPEHHFLGVRGWGPQSTPPDLPNLRVVGPLDDMREAYSQTRVLLMPSAYESYGRVALEAAASGIPSIACRVGGLVEALGDAGIWADRADPDAWVTAISQLDDERSWKERSELAQGRFDELDPALEISHLETALLRIVSTGAV